MERARAKPYPLHMAKEPGHPVIKGYFATNFVHTHQTCLKTKVDLDSGKLEGFVVCISVQYRSATLRTINRSKCRATKILRGFRLVGTYRRAQGVAIAHHYKFLVATTSARAPLQLNSERMR